MKHRPEDNNLRPLSFGRQVARGLIAEQRTRRKAMGGLLFVALLMAVAGSTVLRETLGPRDHLLAFTFYWLACGWLTITALLLAVFDLLQVRAQARAARRAMSEEVVPADD